MWLFAFFFVPLHPVIINKVKKRNDNSHKSGYPVWKKDVV